MSDYLSDEEAERKTYRLPVRGVLNGFDGDDEVRTGRSSFPQCLDPSNLRRAFHSVLKAAELPRIRYHDQRHTYASTLLKAGVEIAEVSRLLGHSSIKITLDVYVHFIPQKERRVSVLSDAMAAARQQRA